MSLSTVLIYFGLFYTIISLAKLYWSWRQSLSGIALGTAMFSLTLFGTQVDLISFLIRWFAEGDVGVALAQSKPSTLLSVVTFILGMVFTGMIAGIGAFGIAKYQGPTRSSEMDAKNADDNPALPLWARLLVSDVKYIIKPNVELHGAEKNPCTIQPAPKPVTWNHLALDLLTQSNTDFGKDAEWSDSDKCLIVEKRDYVSKNCTTVYLLPSQETSISEKTLQAIDRIGKIKDAKDEIIVCFEDWVAPTNQHTDNGVPFEDNIAV